MLSRGDIHGSRSGGEECELWRLGVDDTRKIYAEATAADWRFHAPPINGRLGGTSIPDMWIAVTRDPDNILFEFVEWPRSAFR